MTQPKQIAALIYQSMGKDFRRVKNLTQCPRRVVVVGKWGHELAHPKNCPDCTILQGQVPAAKDKTP